MRIFSFALLSLVECSRVTGSFNGGAAPQRLTYATNPAIYAKGAVIAANLPTSSGGTATAFAVTPALPLGLSLDPHAGTITGIPLGITAQTIYHIVASNSGGATSVDLSITITDTPPQLIFTGAPYNIVIGTLPNLAAPANSGGAIEHCVLAPGSPALPPGLGIDDSTCAITGIATGTTDAAITLTLLVSYEGGTTTATITLQVVPVLTLSPASAVILGHAGQTLQMTTNGGVAPYLFGVSDGPATIDAASGLLTAVGSRYDSATVNVRDGVGEIATAQIRFRLPIVNNRVNALATDGASVYLAGNFTTVNPYPAPHIVGLDPVSGVPQVSFDPIDGFDDQVLSIVRSGNSAYVGGYFLSYRGQPARHLAKIDVTTGALDELFTQSYGFDAVVDAIAVDATGVYVGGAFSSYRFAPAGGLAKLNATSGVLDATFVNPDLDSAVEALALDGNAGLWAAGAMSKFAASSDAPVSIGFLAKIDTTTGALIAAPTPAMFADTLLLKAVQSTDGGIFVAGESEGGAATGNNCFAKIDPTSAAPITSFLPNPNPGTPWPCATQVDVSIPAFAELAGGLLFALHGFHSIEASTFAGSATGPFFKIDFDGTLDTDAVAAVQPPAGVSVLAISVSDSAVVVGGDFSTIDNQPAYNLARLTISSSGLALDAAATGQMSANTTVNAVALADDVLLVGGELAFVGGTAAVGIAKIQPSGEADAHFVSAGLFQTGLASTGDSLATDGSYVYVTGEFDHYGTMPAGFFAKIDATTGAGQPGFGNFTDPPNVVISVGDNLYFGTDGGADFTGALASTASVLRVKNDGTLPVWAPLHGPVAALCAASSKLLVGGEMSDYNSDPISGFTQLDLPTWPPPAEDASGSVAGQVLSIVVDDKYAYLGGVFTSYSDPTSNVTVDNNFAVIEPGINPMSHKRWQPFGNYSFDGQINAIQSFAGATTFVAGAFNVFNAFGRVPNLVDMTADGTASLVPSFSQGGPNGMVNAAIIVGPNLIIGGDFDHYFGRADAFVELLDANSGQPL